MPKPLVSVVVPTHNRPARLARLLESLRAQTLPAEAFEVVIVDDGSDSATGSVIAQELARDELTLTPLRHERPRGPAAARNSGWRTARAEMVAFTDDDCVADPNWLREALEVGGSHGGAVVQGRTCPEPSERPVRGVLTRTVAVESLGPQYETCNIFYPRGTLARLGGFDERFGIGPTAEDTDLAWRAIEAGSATVFAPNALVFHAVQRLGLGGMLRVASRWAPAVRVFKEHPQTRSMLYRGAFWNVWHYLLWRSVLSLAAPVWLRRMLLTLHLMELRRRARRAGAGAWAVPFLVVHDLVECWAIARGGVKYRTFVL